VDPIAGLYDLEKRKFLALPRVELRPLGRSARGQSLYRLHYPGSYSDIKKAKSINYETMTFLLIIF
jgi:hypothetical protein